MIGKTVVKKYLNGEQCFKAYIQTGSIYKASALLAKQGVVNPSTGKPFTPMGVRESAWNDWGFDHLLEARELVRGVWKANGYLLSDEDWYKIVLQRVYYSYRATPKKLEAFLEKHSYMRPYVGR